MAQSLPNEARGQGEASAAAAAEAAEAAGTVGRLLGGAPTDGVDTVTSEEQQRVEGLCADLARPWLRADASRRAAECVLHRDNHVYSMLSNLDGLSRGFSSLDASRPWLVYWILHGLELLGEPVQDELAARVVDFLGRCQHPAGGYGGGPGQQAHLAPTYAAVSALAIVGTDAALASVDRVALRAFLGACKRENGAFAVNEGGEVDTRGTYCALATASLTGTLDAALTAGTAEWLRSCQTYEGGFGSEPYGNEAHAGYTYCGLAAAVLLGEEQSLDLRLLLRWAAQRQMPLEGGFQGRTNKLVDSCYSFWCGALFPLLAAALPDDGAAAAAAASAAAAGDAHFAPWAMSADHLERYVLLCCQARSGGLKDKPGKYPDPYHTCYSLSGLSVAQHAPNGHSPAGESLRQPGNRLRATSPVYNISPDAVDRALAYFRDH